MRFPAEIPIGMTRLSLNSGGIIFTISITSPTSWSGQRGAQPNRLSKLLSAWSSPGWRPTGVLQGMAGTHIHYLSGWSTG